MEKRSSLTKTWGCRQTQGVAVLTFATLLSCLAVAELPLQWAIVLGSGEIVGLGVAAVAGFSALQKQTWIGTGSGVICEKCQLPTVVGTYHCEVCGNCVNAYSHHSYWLNTCICAGNATAYLTGSAALAVTAGCQLAIGGVFLAFLIQRQGTRYSFRYFTTLFYLFFLGAVLISVYILAASCFAFLSHLRKLLSLRCKLGQSKVQPAYVLPGKAGEGNVINGRMVRLYNDSFDSHSAEITGISAMREAESRGPMFSA